MKIIEIIPTLVSGGGERFAVDMANELSHNNEVILLLFRLDGNLSFYLPQVSSAVRVVLLQKHPGFDLSLFFRVNRFIRREKPDIIHTHLKGILYAFLPELSFVRGVHTVHNEPEKEAIDFLSRLVRRFLFRTKRVIPVGISDESSSSFEHFYRIEPVTIFNGRNVPSHLDVSDTVRSELDEYKTDRNTVVIIYLARIEKVKRQLMMAHVAKRLEKEGYNLVVLFIGRDDEQSVVNELRSGMPSCCHILGQRQNPLEYLKAAGAYALCSEYEGLPISLIEALGVGAIPICTPVGGVPNLIKNGVNGILAEENNEESFYIAVKKYLDLSPQQRNNMSSKAFESYAPFSMTECARHYFDLFTQVVEKKY